MVRLLFLDTNPRVPEAKQSVYWIPWFGGLDAGIKLEQLVASVETLIRTWETELYLVAMIAIMIQIYHSMPLNSQDYCRLMMR